MKKTLKEPETAPQGMHMNETTRTFQEYLKANRLKLTSQRRLILDVFVSRGCRVTADELFKEVAELDDGISLSTVYRTVKHLLQSGLARCSHYGDGTTRYEPADGQTSHLVCEVCGRKVPIANPYLECMHAEAARQAGFRMLHCHVTIHGLCHECLTKHEN